MSRSSISHVPQKRHHIRRTRQIAAVTTGLALVLIVVLIMTFLQANRLMREPARQLDTFSSNILPSFQLVSFTSLDGQTRLHGWFFQPDETPKSTVILVHDQGANRLQFDLETATLYDFLLEQGYCVLAFDLRRSGQSDGDLSAFGYAEWEDVLAAIGYVRSYAVTTDVLLYGFGSGVTASLLALDHLPAANADGDALDSGSYSEEILELGVDQSYVKGLILDTACASGDEYIRAACRADGFWGQLLLQHTVPFAIRFSAGSSLRTSLVTLLTKVQMPVYLTASESVTYVSQGSIQTVFDERTRFHPDETTIYLSEGNGYSSGFLTDQENYLNALADWLD